MGRNDRVKITAPGLVLWVYMCVGGGSPLTWESGDAGDVVCCVSGAGTSCLL